MTERGSLGDARLYAAPLAAPGGAGETLAP